MFQVGKEYSYQQLYEHTDKLESIEDHWLVSETIGKSAVHVEYDGKDYWFILHSANATNFFYKCVYGEWNGIF